MAAASPEIQHLIETSRLALLGRVLPSVLHQMSTPLGAVALRAESLAQADESSAPVDAAKRQRYLKAILDETRRCQELLAALREFASAEESAEAPLDVVLVCGAALRLLEHEALRRQVTLQLEGERVLIAKANARLLEHAVIALVVSALDAGPRGGRVRIAVGREGGHFVVAVEAEGAALPETVRERLSRPWPASVRPSEPEGDVSLTAVRAIAELHGGSLATEAGATGTRLLLSLPARKEADAG